MLRERQRMRQRERRNGMWEEELYVRLDLDTHLSEEQKGGFFVLLEQLQNRLKISIFQIQDVKRKE